VDFAACPKRANFKPDSTLARFETALNLVDHVNPALAADQTVVAVATAQRFQRVTDLHGNNPDAAKGRYRQAETGKMGFIPPAAVPPGTRGFYAMAWPNVNPNRPFRAFSSEVGTVRVRKTIKSRI
jgi:hypothetical protein